MPWEPLDVALRDRGDEPVSAVVERWVLRNLRADMAEPGFAEFLGATIESIDLAGTYPDTRIVTRMTIDDRRTGARRHVGFTHELWFIGEDGELFDGDDLIKAVDMEPFDQLYLGTLHAAVSHHRGQDRLIPRRIEQDADGGEVEWIDFPMPDFHSSPEEAAIATEHWTSRDRMRVVSCVVGGDRATVVVDGPWNRPRTVTCERDGDRWRAVWD